jgi:glycosyltransferase involved in cell wall biosynthesis
MQTSPTISVIVPMYNAASTIERCMAALLAMLDRGDVEEIIVVDDCSTDPCAAIVARYPAVRLERVAKQNGPAAARNHAAGLASGRYLWFVDSDVVVTDDSARVLSQAFADTAAGAIFGCYDDSPGASNFLSQYKNLVHRYYHVTGSENASTFWAGCGAIERDLFFELGGFAAHRYREPSIEDIELGYRIVESGRRIVLRRDLQGKHLKEWRLKHLLRTDIYRRAIPWSRLMLERRHLTADLNVGVAERLRALLALGSVLALLFWAAGLTALWLPVAALAGSALANLQFIRFFKSHRGAWFAVRAFLYHQLYYLYSSAAFGYASLEHVVKRFEERMSARRMIRNRGG